MQDMALHRSLSWVQGIAMATGAVLGSGILILPAITAEKAGPASIVSWVMMSLLAFPLARTLGRLGTTFPHAGGIVEYTRLAFGERAGYIASWLFLGTIPIGMPIIALVGSTYAVTTFRLPHGMTAVIAVILLLGSLILHRRGIDVASWIQVFVLMLIFILIIVAVAVAFPHMRGDNFHPFFPHGWMPMVAAGVEIFWSFIGWEMVGHLAEEFRHPQRDLKRTFIFAPALVGALYVALAFATVGIHAYGPGHGALFSDLIGSGLGRVGSWVTGIMALLITMVAIHGNIAGFSRMVYSQARAGVFPTALGRVHPHYKTPTGALGALGVDFLVVVGIYTIFHVHMGTLIEWPSTVFLVLYDLAMVASLKILTGQRWMPLVPIIICTALYLFSGWATIFPIVLAGMATIVFEIRKKGVCLNR